MLSGTQTSAATSQPGGLALSGSKNSQSSGAGSEDYCVSKVPQMKFVQVIQSALFYLIFLCRA